MHRASVLGLFKILYVEKLPALAYFPLGLAPIWSLPLLPARTAGKPSLVNHFQVQHCTIQQLLYTIMYASPSLTASE